MILSIVRVVGSRMTDLVTAIDKEGASGRLPLMAAVSVWRALQPSCPRIVLDNAPTVAPCLLNGTPQDLPSVRQALLNISVSVVNVAIAAIDSGDAETERDGINKASDFAEALAGQMMFVNEVVKVAPAAATGQPSGAAGAR